METTTSPPNQPPLAVTKPVVVKSRLREFYKRHEKYSGLVIFSIGFIWDSFTMTRVDNIIDNIILLFYLSIIAAMIIIMLRRQCGITPVGWIQKLEPRFLWAMQFCFGGLFSSYVIFYFKSASFTRTQFFFLIIVIFWIGNEFLEHRLKNHVLLAALYCFCLFSFFAFFLPVALARISASIFRLAGFLSLFLSLAVFSVGYMPDRAEWRRRMTPVAAWILAVFATVNILYFINLIPPVPLALKRAGIYHYVKRTSAGYVVKYVPPSLLRFWRNWDNPFYYTPGESVYCYTAVFAPSRVHVPIYHVWSRKWPQGWARTDRINIDITGGRDGGFRGFTTKTGIIPGEWRVEVETEGGQTLGRIDFTVVLGPTRHPALRADLIR